MPKDILINGSYDMEVKNGDFFIGESTRQHQNILIRADKGEFKQSPRAGVGILRFLEGGNSDGLAREIRTEFVKDGMSVQEIRFSGSKIDITANYNY